MLSVLLYSSALVEYFYYRVYNSKYTRAKKPILAKSSFVVI